MVQSEMLVSNNKLIVIKTSGEIKYYKMHRIKIFLAITAIVFQHSINNILCQPLLYDPTTMAAASGQMLAMPMMSPMLYGPQLDPYSAMQMPAQFLMASPYGGMMPAPAHMMGFDGVGRRSAGSRSPLMGHSSSKHSDRSNEQPEDQKAMEDLPVNFADDPPSSFTERLSESFSALGEGVKNHFKSISENFSDTVDDIKDAWRSSGNSNKDVA